MNDFRIGEMRGSGGSTAEIVKNAITAGGARAGDFGDSGLLPVKAAERFVEMAMDSSEFLRETTFRQTNYTKGTFPLLGVSQRNFRKEVENSNEISGNEIKPIIKDVPYETVGITQGTEISNKFFRENVEREGFHNKFFGLVAKQTGLDSLDLALNGDASSSDPFISINDGWLKILQSGIPAGQRIDGSSLASGDFTDLYFYELFDAIPEKYFSSSYRWICSHKTKNKVARFLRNRSTALGDAAIIGGKSIHPLDIPFSVPTGFPNNRIILGDPAQLITVWTFNVGMVETREGKELVSKGNRFYAFFFDTDYIVELPDSFAMLTNVGDVAPL